MNCVSYRYLVNFLHITHESGSGVPEPKPFKADTAYNTFSIFYTKIQFFKAVREQWFVRRSRYGKIQPSPDSQHCRIKNTLSNDKLKITVGTFSEDLTQNCVGLDQLQISEIKEYILVIERTAPPSVFQKCAHATSPCSVCSIERVHLVVYSNYLTI